MKTYITLIILLTLASISGCNKEIYLENPDIRLDPFEPSILDTVTTTLIGEVKIDKKSQKVDSYNWLIYDQNNSKIIPILSQANEAIKWVPPSEGVYTIEVTVISGNKTLKQSKQIKINYDINAVQNLLTGMWEGTSTAPYFNGVIKKVKFTFQETGAYSANIIGITNGTFGNSALYNADDSKNHPNKKLILQYVNDANRYAYGIINYVHPGGGLMSWDVTDLELTNGYNNLSFTSGHRGSIKYKLVRK